MPKYSDIPTELTNVDGDDILAVLATPSTSPTTKKAKARSILAGPEIKVAASNASDNWKKHADYVCDGVADDVQIEAAIAALPSTGGVVILSMGYFYADTLDFTDLGECFIAMVGQSILGTRIYFDGADGTDYAASLKGTSWFRMENLTIDGNSKANYGLFCGRTAGATAGKHQFTNVRVVGCKIASHLNYASEENTYIKCQFQRSPIGAIFTAYPVVADPSVLASTPADFTATYQSSIAHHLYDCAIGSEAYTTRCGLMTLGSMVKMYGGAIQAGDGAEAYVIIDATRRQCSFFNVDLDGNLADIGYKIGYFTQGLTPAVSWGNRIHISGGHMTLDGTSGTAYISAYWLRDSIIECVSVNGPAAAGIDLLDTNCRGNLFVNCIQDDHTDITITDTSAGANNIWIGDGGIRFLAASGATDPEISYNSSLPNRLSVTGGLWINPGASTNAIAFRATTEAADRFNISNTAILQFGNGTDATDTILYRSAADVLRTGDMFVADDGIVTQIKAGVPDDTDFVDPQSGLIAIDTTNNRIYVRVGTTWKYAALT